MFMAYFIVISIFSIGILVSKAIMDGVMASEERELSDLENKM
ncbi:hypothetical protein JOC85_004341 [Bacillus mesophilus]|nr:hypothetical protein [Bacillus mesophilus]MBM7663465.1 hypothetical protein [Bacillus mesophilus]